MNREGAVFITKDGKVFEFTKEFSGSFKISGLPKICPGILNGKNVFFNDSDNFFVDFWASDCEFSNFSKPESSNSDTNFMINSSIATFFPHFFQFLRSIRDIFYKKIALSGRHILNLKKRCAETCLFIKHK